MELVQSLLVQRRKEHKEAVQTLLAMNDYAKQYKMIDILATKTFQVKFLLFLYKKLSFLA